MEAILRTTLARFIIVLLICLLAVNCVRRSRGAALNSPYPSSEATENAYYVSYSERPKHLDPARSYSSNEIVFTAQIYEPPLQYHFLVRPYQLIPLTLVDMPLVQYFSANGELLKEEAEDSLIATTEYILRINPGISYQQHPAFARDPNGNYLYHNLQDEDCADLLSPQDLPVTGTKELEADDYVYQIKRLASPQVQSPISGFMSAYILGLAELSERLSALPQGTFIDLREYDLPGVKALDRYTLKIVVKGKYPQFLYWLAMPFFSPIPYEVDRFYSQLPLISRNITLDYFPVGTGPYTLAVNEQNRRMELIANPNFHGEVYPDRGEQADSADGLLKDAGKRLPFINRVIFSLEKESIPAWSKFLQGYYDRSGISADTFDQAVRFGDSGEALVTDEMANRGISLVTAVSPSIYYTGFNMLDPVVGGYSESAISLRRALSIVLDTEEYVSIFANGRGIPAHGPIPPGIFGYVEGREGINSAVYTWSSQGRPQRRGLDEAKELLAAAGYPDGRDAKTGEPLVLYFDSAGAGPEGKAEMDWMVKKFGLLGVQLVIRATDYNTFQDKMRKGAAQIYQWGWNADYPDPENFLFLLYGPNSKVDAGGENASNYNNPRFNELFERMRNQTNCPERTSTIGEMVKILQHDAPWIWMFHPKSYALSHRWLHNLKPNSMANNSLKYIRLDAEERAFYRDQWNQPVWEGPVLLLILILWGAVIARRKYRQFDERKGCEELR